MYSSVQPGTQIGVQVSPVCIEGYAMMKLKITWMSTNGQERLYNQKALKQKAAAYLGH